MSWNVKIRVKIPASDEKSEIIKSPINTTRIVRMGAMRTELARQPLQKPLRTETPVTPSKAVEVRQLSVRERITRHETKTRDMIEVIRARHLDGTNKYIHPTRTWIQICKYQEQKTLWYRIKRHLC